MSTMNTEGYNLALFDDGHLEDRIRCIDVELLEVEKIHYTTSLFID